MSLRFSARLACTSLPLLFLVACGGGGGSTTPPPPPPITEVITITTDQSIQCVLTIPFSLTLKATGNSSPLTWTITSGQLPTGLSLDSQSGTISGTPVAGNGGGAVTIKAADSKAVALKVFSFSLYNKLTIDPLTPPNAHTGAAYTISVTAEGSLVASWTISSGSLPPGLALTPNGNTAIISGTPTQVGSFPFTLQATDNSIPQSATLNLTLIVDSHVALTKSTLKDGRQGQPYSDTFSATGGKTPYHWSWTGTLPSGVTLNAGTGIITGTPVDSGSFAYTVTVTDSSATAQTDSAQQILNIAMPLVIFNNLGPTYINVNYYDFLSAAGGFYPYTWSLASGSLPPGLELTSSGNIRGVPRQLGAYPCVVQVTDSGNPAASTTKSITLNVTPTPINMAYSPLSPAPVNILYHSQISTTGGTPPYSWSVTSGALPPGLAFDGTTGFIDGTPTTVGTFNFLVKGTDSSNPQQSATANEFIVIRNSLGRNDSIATATPLGNSQNINVPIVFSLSPYIDPINNAAPNPDTDFFKLVANGGSIVHVSTSAQFGFSAPRLDTVIELLDSNGTRFSTCNQPSYASDCLNDDMNSSTVDSAIDFKVPGSSTSSTTFFVHVFDWWGDARPDYRYYLSISGVIEPLTIVPSSLGLGATRGVSYQQQFTTAGGTGNATWSLGGGSLPPGWSLSSSGLLSGIATSNGNYSFSIKASDASNPPQVAVAQFNLRIADPVAITTPATFPNACANKPYSFQVKVSGGIPPIFFGFSSPAWISINLDQSTGIFSGSTGGTGTFTGMLSANDSAQPSSGQLQQVSLTVVNCP